MQELLETQVQSLGQEDSPRVGNDNPLQYSCLGDYMDQEAWRATVHRVTRHDGALTLKRILMHAGLLT